jgi:hypothetical protein
VELGVGEGEEGQLEVPGQRLKHVDAKLPQIRCRPAR